MITIRPMTHSDHSAAVALWQTSDGIGLSEADSIDGIRAYLDRNPGLSLCAWDNAVLIGTVLVGHDGRRGYLHHLCVHEAYRGNGLGRQLVEGALLGLQDIGLDKAHAFLFTDNDTGRGFWEHCGWTWRTDIGIISCTIDRKHI